MMRNFEFEDDNPDVFQDAQEFSYNMEIGRGILAIKELDTAVKYVTEYGDRFGWDVDIRDDIIQLLVDEQKGIANDILYAYHLTKTDGEEDPQTE
jgi:hypothetical protein